MCNMNKLLLKYVALFSQVCAHVWLIIIGACVFDHVSGTYVHTSLNS